MNERINEFAEQCYIETYGVNGELLDRSFNEKKFAEKIIRYVCIAGSIKGSTDSDEYIRGRQDLVTHIKAEFGIDGARHPWICAECNTDRSKAVCPRGYSATLRADCPIGSMQHTI